LSSAFLPKKNPLSTAHLLEDIDDEAAPVVKYRKSQRFYHCKVSRKLVFVGKLLEKMLKHHVWTSLGDKLEAEDERNVANPMCLTMIRANLELGLYSNAEMCVADIMLALANAKGVCRDTSQSTAMQFTQLQMLQAQFEKDLLAGKMRAKEHGYGELRQDLALSNAPFLELTKDLVDRTMDRPETEPFQEPVRPIVDGCADYTDVIREPIDLGTIRDRLDAPGTCLCNI
jgi:hypothetical protein